MFNDTVYHMVCAKSYAGFDVPSGIQMNEFKRILSMSVFIISTLLKILL